jgi:hypothetical protein
MTLYAAALFLHIVGALLLVAALTVEGIALRQVGRAITLGQVRDSAGIAGLTRVVGPAAALGILLPGLYMTATNWGWIPWILVGFAAWLLVAGLGAVNGVRLAALGRATGADAERPSPELAAQLKAPLLVASWRVRAAILVGIVLLMTIKPDLVGSLLTIGVAALLGLAAALPAWGSPPARERPQRRGA